MRSRPRRSRSATGQNRASQDHPVPARAAHGPSRRSRPACCRRGCRPVFWASLMPASSITGTVVMPSLRAASSAPMPGNDAVVAVGQDRVGEAELADRRRDLRHLLVTVRPCIPRIGDQRRKRAVLYLEVAIEDVHASDPPEHKGLGRSLRIASRSVITTFPRRNARYFAGKVRMAKRAATRRKNRCADR